MSTFQLVNTRGNLNIKESHGQIGVTTIVPVLMPLSDTTDVQACMYKIFTFTINSFRDFLHLSRRLVEFLMLIQSVLRAKKITWTFLII